MGATHVFSLEDHVIQFLTCLNDNFQLLNLRFYYLWTIYHQLTKIQEESNNISLPPNRDPSLTTDDPNTLINAADSRKFQAHGKPNISKLN